MFRRLSHEAIRVACRRGDRCFHAQREQLEQVQRDKLKRLLAACRQEVLPELSGVDRWESFVDRVPLSRYGDWRERLQKQRESEHAHLVRSPVLRYQPTSGSSDSLKLIPYTDAFLQELDNAISPWMSSLYRQHPALFKTSHYWSVSWLPESQRKNMTGNINDDSELLGGIKRFFASRTQAVPSAVAWAGSAEDALFATLAYLVADAELGSLSVWSPTFALQLLSSIVEHGDELSCVLRTCDWGRRRKGMGRLRAPSSPRQAMRLQQALSLPLVHVPALLWPRLALLSAWDTADAALPAQELQRLFPGVAFEGKGLWATEGVLSIPYDGLYPLAYQSHVYEFEQEGSSRVLAPWQLREGDVVSPVLSSGNGLLRYCLDDRVAVSGFWGNVPCLRFLGRRHGVDLVGEKISPDTARAVMTQVAIHISDDCWRMAPVILLAVQGGVAQRSRYVAVFESIALLSGQAGAAASLQSSANDVVAVALGDRGVLHSALSDALEVALSRHFHYELARNLGQLGPAIALVSSDGWSLYKRIAMADGMIEGNIKPEAVRRVSNAAMHKILPYVRELFLEDKTALFARPLSRAIFAERL